MSILFFDLETSGFPNRLLPDDDARQPHIVQFAAILADDLGNELATAKMLVKPPHGFVIPEQAVAVHGITTEHAMEFGVPIAVAAYILDSFAGSVHAIVAHNIAFDSAMMGIAYARLKKASGLLCYREFHFCTMLATTGICKLPGSRGDYKWPKLSEAYQHLFGEPLIGAHDAMVDVRATARIYFELKRRAKAEAPHGNH